MVDAREGSTPRVWLQTAAGEMEARLSFDQRWVAFTSNSSGKDEIYVAPFDHPTESVKISRNGGRRAAWKRDGSELYFMTTDGAIYRVPITSSPALDAGEPQLLFRSGEGTWTSFDAAADGTRFLVAREISGPRTRPIEVVTNWRGLIE
jgi:Tol biopolymer transport system component